MNHEFIYMAAIPGLGSRAIEDANVSKGADPQIVDQPLVDSSSPRHLYIVCCHAIFHGTDPQNEAHWALASFQKGSDLRPGEHHTFFAHIRAGLRQLLSHQIGDAVLVFSGAATKKSQFPSLTEARSYLDAAILIEGGCSDSEYILLEENATDSYQNLLFSILSFHRRFRRYPAFITVITHAFKERRFLNCHAEAIRWPRKRIEVLGIDPDWGRDLAGRIATIQSEERCIMAWKADPHGVGEELNQKRVERGYCVSDCSKVLTSSAELVQQLITQSRPISTDRGASSQLPWQN